MQQEYVEHGGADTTVMSPPWASKANPKSAEHNPPSRSNGLKVDCVMRNQAVPYWAIAGASSRIIPKGSQIFRDIFSSIKIHM